MELSQWFDSQLHSTMDGFIWAVQQVPTERLQITPPKQLGEWSAAQHVFHMLDYEQRFVLPSMAQWLGVPAVIPEDTESGLEANPSSVEAQLTQFGRVRQAQINMLPKVDQAAWSSIQRTTFWGDISLYWLVTKTLQHTAEHTHNVLSLTLFWDTTQRSAH